MPDRITVTYTLHPTTGPQREHLLDALTGIQAQLPLRNLHWKPSTRTALRTIQEINVRLVDLGEVGPPREVGGSVMDGALLNICLVACDVGAILVPVHLRPVRPHLRVPAQDGVVCHQDEHWRIAHSQPVSRWNVFDRSTDSKDGDIYKTATRSFIRDWLSLLSSRRNVYAPLIILVNPPTAKDTGKNVFGRDKGILGKLKTDFNLPKRDRYVAQA